MRGRIKQVEVEVLGKLETDCMKMDEYCVLKKESLELWVFEIHVQGQKKNHTISLRLGRDSFKPKLSTPFVPILQHPPVQFPKP